MIRINSYEQSLPVIKIFCEISLDDQVIPVQVEFF